MVLTKLNEIESETQEYRIKTDYTISQVVLNQVYTHASSDIEQDPLLCEDCAPQTAVLRVKRSHGWCTKFYKEFDSIELFKKRQREEVTCHAICRITSTDITSGLSRGQGGNQTKNKVEDKYWKKRYNFFSRYDEGISMDEESWFEVTPETVARHIADRMSECKTICDATAGVGGNAIQFARTGNTEVICVDIDQDRLKKCHQNAKVYNVADRMQYHHGNFSELLPQDTKVDAVFISPPWGGPSHLEQPSFGLQDVEYCDIVELFTTACTKWSRNVVLYLPRHTDLHELAALATFHGYSSFEVEKIYFAKPTRHLKLIVVYFGPIFTNGNPFPAERTIKSEPVMISKIMNALPFAGPLYRKIYTDGIVGRYLIGADCFDKSKNEVTRALARYVKIPEDDCRSYGVTEVLNLLNTWETVKLVRSHLRRKGELSRNEARVSGGVSHSISPTRKKSIIHNSLTSKISIGVSTTSPKPVVGMIGHTKDLRY